MPMSIRHPHIPGWTPVEGGEQGVSGEEWWPLSMRLLLHFTITLSVPTFPYLVPIGLDSICTRSSHMGPLTATDQMQANLIADQTGGQTDHTEPDLATTLVSPPLGFPPLVNLHAASICLWFPLAVLPPSSLGTVEWPGDTDGGQW